MKKWPLFFLTGFIACSILQPSFTPKPHEILEGKASYVIDGDTFYFSFDRGKFKSKLYGIEAPGLREKMGREAFEFLRNHIHQKNIHIEFLEVDSSDRWIVNANLDSEEKLQLAIVENGFARAMDPEFKAVESFAQAKSLGIWSDKGLNSPVDIKSQPNH